MDFKYCSDLEQKLKEYENIYEEHSDVVVRSASTSDIHPKSHLTGISSNSLENGSPTKILSKSDYQAKDNASNISSPPQLKDGQYNEPLGRSEIAKLFEVIIYYY